MRFLMVVAAAFILSVAAHREATADTPMLCIADSGVPPVVSAEGTKEAVSDVVISCTGGTLGRIAQVDIQISLNTNITNQAMSAGSGNPLLAVGEWATIQGRQDAPGTVTFPFVTVDEPGPGGLRMLYIRNVFADASQLFNQFPDTNPAIVESLYSSAFEISNPVQPVGVVMAGGSLCDSPLSIMPGSAPLLVARNVSVGSASYNALLSAVALPDGSVGLSVAAAQTTFPAGCPSASSLTPEGLLNINYVNVNGTYYWIKASYVSGLPGAVFDVTAYGSGPVLDKQPQ